MEVRAVKRIQKELETLQRTSTADGFTVNPVSRDTWHVVFVCPPETLYAGETHTLSITFPNNYPMEAPIVVFLRPSPEHCHIYSNGHICLNILGDDWSPALTVKSVVMSIISMLASSKSKTRPPNDESYSRHGSSNPKKTHFVYEDDSV